MKWKKKIKKKLAKTDTKNKRKTDLKDMHAKKK
jgi:hypothetical protein